MAQVRRDDKQNQSRRLASVRVLRSLAKQVWSPGFSRLILCLSILIFGGSLTALFAQPAAPSLRGFISAHDPSTMIRCKNRYYIFSTGQEILSKSSADKV